MAYRSASSSVRKPTLSPASESEPRARQQEEERDRRRERRRKRLAECMLIEYGGEIAMLMKNSVVTADCLIKMDLPKSEGSAQGGAP